MQISEFLVSFEDEEAQFIMENQDLSEQRVMVPRSIITRIVHVMEHLVNEVNQIVQASENQKG